MGPSVPPSKPMSRLRDSDVFKMFGIYRSLRPSKTMFYCFLHFFIFGCFFIWRFFIGTLALVARAKRGRKNLKNVYKLSKKNGGKKIK